MRSYTFNSQSYRLASLGLAVLCIAGIKVFELIFERIPAAPNEDPEFATRFMATIFGALALFMFYSFLSLNWKVILRETELQATNSFLWKTWRYNVPYSEISEIDTSTSNSFRIILKNGHTIKITQHLSFAYDDADEIAKKAFDVFPVKSKDQVSAFIKAIISHKSNGAFALANGTPEAEALKILKTQ